jgi:hypothetical protein
LLVFLAPFSFVLQRPQHPTPECTPVITLEEENEKRGGGGEWGLLIAVERGVYCLPIASPQPPTLYHLPPPVLRHFPVLISTPRFTLKLRSETLTG